MSKLYNFIAGVTTGLSLGFASTTLVFLAKFYAPLLKQLSEIQKDNTALMYQASQLYVINTELGNALREHGVETNQTQLDHKNQDSGYL